MRECVPRRGAAAIDGKARLVSESYCDGLGDCLPECPTGAITIEERDAQAFDKAAVQKRMGAKKTAEESLERGCPSTHACTLDRSEESPPVSTSAEQRVSQLRQWPCQIKLVPVNAPYFKGARLLVAADCCAFANANVHSDFMKNKITLIGCPKLDGIDYAEKLAQIIKNNDIKSIDVLRMSVPCCGGLENAVKKALISSGKMACGAPDEARLGGVVPWSVTVIDTNGEVLE